MLPDYPRLVKCPHCKNMLWIEEAKELGQSEPFSRLKKYKGAKAYIVLIAEDYLHYLAKVKIDKEKEFYLRLQTWWASNDRHRQDPPDNMSLSVEEIRNLEFLFSMLAVDDASDRIMKAEIARELGRYKECLSLLNHNFNHDLMYVVDTIRQLAQDGTNKVAELHYD